MLLDLGKEAGIVRVEHLDEPGEATGSCVMLVPASVTERLSISSYLFVRDVLYARAKNIRSRGEPAMEGSEREL
jgi:hypothetical protein